MSEKRKDKKEDDKQALDYSELLTAIIETEPFCHWTKVSSRQGEEKYRDYRESKNPSIELSRWGLHCYKQGRRLKSLAAVARQDCTPSLSHLIPKQKDKKDSSGRSGSSREKAGPVDQRREREAGKIARRLGKGEKQNKEKKEAAKKRWCGFDLQIMWKYFCDQRGMDRSWVDAKLLYNINAHVVQYERKEKDSSGGDSSSGDSGSEGRSDGGGAGEKVTEIRVPLVDVDGNLIQLWRCQVDPKTGKRVGKGKSLMFSACRDRAIAFGLARGPKAIAKLGLDLEEGRYDEHVIMEGLENALTFYSLLAKPQEGWKSVGMEERHHVQMLVIAGKAGLGRVGSFLSKDLGKNVVVLDSDTDNGAVIASESLGVEVQRFVESSKDILDAWNSGLGGEDEKSRQSRTTEVAKWKSDLRFVPLSEVQETIAAKENKELIENEAEPLRYARMRRPWTDAGIAKQFLENFASRVRVSEDDRWWVWNKKRGIWTTEKAEGQVREWLVSLGLVYEQIARAEFGEGSPGRENCLRVANSICNSSKQSAVMKLLHGSSSLSCEIEDFDANKDILNLQDGALDLKTGELLPPHSPELMCSLQANVRWEGGKGSGGSGGSGGGESGCPRFEQFLDEICCGDADLLEYKLRQMGYAMSGHTGEKVLFFHLGSGNNGKSVEAELLLRMLGGYAKTVGSQLLLEQYGSTGSSEQAYELSRLPGVRLAVCGETDENKTWSEATVKRITGGEDRLVARVIRQAPFEFKPQFKIIVHGNNHPRVRAGDIAFWERIHLVPYEHTVEKSEVDTALVEKLWKERSAILRLMFMGLADWRTRGSLDAPEKILEAREEYQASIASDIQEWVAVDCKRDADAETKATELYAAYVDFCKNVLRTRPKSQNAFGRELTRLGFASRKSHGNMIREGIVPRTESEGNR